VGIFPLPLDPGSLYQKLGQRFGSSTVLYQIFARGGEVHAANAPKRLSGWVVTSWRNQSYHLINQKFKTFNRESWTVD
jgi:hypothetical protein